MWPSYLEWFGLFGRTRCSVLMVSTPPTNVHLEGVVNAEEGVRSQGAGGVGRVGGREEEGRGKEGKDRRELENESKQGREGEGMEWE